MESNKRRDRLVLLVVPAVTLAVVIILVSVLGGGHKRTKVIPPNQVARLLDGIPQHDLELGSPNAPVTLVEFADLQCPFCGNWERQTLPVLVRKYVRPGKVKIQFRGLHFLGPDSETALRAVLAAGTQNKLWQVLENLYERQGQENSGWVTEELLRQVGDAVPGLDAKRMLAESGSLPIAKQVKETTQLAQAIGVNSTPTFFAARRGAKLDRVQLRSLDPAGIEPTLDRLLAG
jgi:protein-disulfide isomerase